MNVKVGKMSSTRAEPADHETSDMGLRRSANRKASTNQVRRERASFTPGPHRCLQSLVHVLCKVSIHVQSCISEVMGFFGSTVHKSKDLVYSAVMGELRTRGSFACCDGHTESVMHVL